MKPMLVPERDLKGATPEKLVKALFRRTVPLRPRRVRKSIIPDKIAVSERPAK